jgi:Heterokaryon incompatibility protein (HET)
MVVTEELEEKFLWVDSLCICHDEVTSKYKQIYLMSSIYSCVLATSIPLAGIDENTTFYRRFQRPEHTVHPDFITYIT